jgi:predicted acetyltransferase
MRDKEKQAEYHRKYYQENKEKYFAKARSSQKRFADWYKELKRGLACKECGENHPACLHFHHRNPEEKEYNIVELRQKQSRRLVLAELAKCDVLCANCHAKLHWPDE